MVDLKIIRQNPDSIRETLQKRNMDLDLDAFLALDKARLEVQKEIEGLQTERNRVSKEIPTMSDQSQKTQKIAEMKTVGEKIAALEETLKESEEAYFDMYYSIPNFLSDTTAIGKDESENVIESKFSEPTKFDFTPRDHDEIGEARGWIDSKKAAELSGARFWYLKGELVQLQFAIMNYALNFMMARGFFPMIPPYLVRERALFGTGFFPADKSQIYSVNPEDDNLFLIGTSEVPLTAYHMDEVIDLEKTIRYFGYSACFRREAGTYGKDMKGILRGHQFDKLEMVCMCKPEEAEALHNEMVATEEALWQSLGIPYQKLNICSGDLGNVAMKKYDLEAWMPGQQRYREVTSCSNCGTFQSRRLNIRFKREDGSLDYVYTLNGTIIAFSRCLIALIENYQNADMTVRIPEVIQPYMGGRAII